MQSFKSLTALGGFAIFVKKKGCHSLFCLWYFEAYNDCKDGNIKINKQQAFLNINLIWIEGGAERIERKQKEETKGKYLRA